MELEFTVLGEVRRKMSGPSIAAVVQRFEKETGAIATAVLNAKTFKMERVEAGEWEVPAEKGKGLGSRVSDLGDASGAELVRDDVKIVPTKRKGGRKPDGLRVVMGEVLASPKLKRSVEGWVALATWREAVVKAAPEWADKVTSQPWHNAVSNMVRDGEVTRRGSHSTAEFMVGPVEKRKGLGSRVSDLGDGSGVPTKKKAETKGYMQAAVEKTRPLQHPAGVGGMVLPATGGTKKELVRQAMETLVPKGGKFTRGQLEAQVAQDHGGKITSGEVAVALCELRERDIAVDLIQRVKDDPMGTVYMRMD